LAPGGAWTDVILGNQRVNERDDDRGLDAGEEPERRYPGDRRRCQAIVHLAGLVARTGLLFGRANGKRRNRSDHADALKKFPPTHALIVRHGALQAWPRHRVLPILDNYGAEVSWRPQGITKAIPIRVPLKWAAISGSVQVFGRRHAETIDAR
jgi:hypothetical protein